MVECKLTIFGLFAVVNAQFLFEMVHTLIGTAQHTGHVGANLNMIFCLGFFEEHVVIANHRAYLGRLQVEHHR